MWWGQRRGKEGVCTVLCGGDRGGESRGFVQKCVVGTEEGKGGGSYRAVWWGQRRGKEGIHTEQSIGKPSAKHLSHAILKWLHFQKLGRVSSIAVSLQRCDAGQLQHHRCKVLVLGQLQMPSAVGRAGVAVTVLPSIQHPTARYTAFASLPYLHTLSYPWPPLSTPTQCWVSLNPVVGLRCFFWGS